MINDQLRAVIDRALDRERISAEDVRELQREVFEHGLTCREEGQCVTIRPYRRPEPIRYEGWGRKARPFSWVVLSGRGAVSAAH